MSIFNEDAYWDALQYAAERWNDEPIGDCAECGEPYFEGDDVYEIADGEVIHRDCLESWAKPYEYTAVAEECDG